jgi:hypothetical protein
MYLQTGNGGGKEGIQGSMAIIVASASIDDTLLKQTVLVLGKCCLLESGITTKLVPLSLPPLISLCYQHHLQSKPDTGTGRLLT